MAIRQALDVDVAGLIEAARGLKHVGDREAGRTTGKGIRRFVSELRRRAESKGRSRGGVHAHVIREGFISERKTITGAEIELDGRVEPGFGAEFGARRFAQFPAFRGNDWTDPERSRTGYMLHPALRERLPEAVDRLAKDLVQLLDDETR